MGTGECSGVKTEEDDGVWAKLVPVDPKYPEFDIRSQETVICSEVTCSSPEKHDWCVITRVLSSGLAMIKNISPSAIVVDEAVVLKENVVDIKCGCEIISGPERKGHLVFTFKVTEFPKHDRNSLVIPLDVEHAKCSICLNIWHDVVTIAPCLHNFCNGCFSEWLRRSEKRHQDVLCPQCRATVHSVGRNHFLHNIEEAILQNCSSLRRSNGELTLLDKYASIQSNIVLGSQPISSRKRPLSLTSDDYDAISHPCPQCGTQLGGFRCSQTTPHLQCQACRGMMPSRPNIGIPQHCEGCDQAFCGAYWQAQLLDAGDAYTFCSPETFRPILERSISQIPDSAHEHNRFEQAITERCIQQMGKTLQAVISEWIVKFNNGELDRTTLQLNLPERITPRTCICNDCYHKLISYLLYWFRISTPRYLLSPDASKREDCWYGYTCRTQHHSDEHARKRNHVCRPTRGNPPT